MSGVNECILVGNVGDDPEIRATNSGKRLAKFSLATNRKYKGQDDVQWHRCTAFGPVVDVIEQYVHKGDKLYVRGRIEYSTTEGTDGQKRYYTDIIVHDLQMLGGKSEPAPATTGGGTGMEPDLPFQKHREPGE